jgi:hypothetical protein
MDKALKAKWLEALRSGRYKQGQRKLRNQEDEFCCLGVLCDISGQGQWRQGDNSSTYRYCKEWESAFCCLPSFMEEFSGIGEETEEDLIALNDIDELSFPEIADWIEENIKGE